MKIPQLLHCPTLQKVSINDLHAFPLQEQEVRIQVITHGRITHTTQHYLQNRSWRMEKFSTALQLLQSAENAISIVDESGMLWEHTNSMHNIDIDINQNISELILSESFKVHRVFWVSKAQANTPGHFDDQPNCNIQLHGAKRFIFYPPELRTALGCGTNVSNSRYIPIDLLQDKPFPEHRIELMSGAGDIVFIPKGWIHAVETLEDSVNVAQWYEILSCEAGGTTQ